MSQQPQPARHDQPARRAMRLPNCLRVVCLLLVLLGVTGCDRQPAAAPQAAADATALLLSASSLSEVLSQIAADYHASHTGSVNISSGGSNALARMILAGSPGDLYFSANNQWADVVEQQNLASHRVTLLTNQLVLIVPKGNPAGIHEPADLFKLKEPSARLMLAGEKVPAGQYAKQALTHLHLYKKLVEQDRIARGQNVRQAMLYVETGQAVAGIVYATDARASDDVQVVYTFDPQSHEPITCSLLLLKSASTSPLSQSFYNYLQSPKALAVFEAHGFGVASTIAQPSAVANDTIETTIETTIATTTTTTATATTLWLSHAEWQAISLSLLVGVTAVVMSLPFGVLLGWVLARKRFPGKALVETLLNLPLVLPPVVTGYLLLVAFGTHGWLGSHLYNWFGIRIVFDWKGAAIASAVIAFPLMTRAVRIAFTSVDHRLENAARTLGAGPADVFFSVILPLARHGIIAGCVLAFARSIGEFGATIMIAGSIPGQTRTMPLYIFNLLESPGGVNAAWRIVTVSIIIAAAALIISEYLERRDHPAANGSRS